MIVADCHYIKGLGLTASDRAMRQLQPIWYLEATLHTDLGDRAVDRKDFLLNDDICFASF
jgi:hypothetical protein